MKRYLAFYGNVYYPLGGMNDFVGDYDTEQDCEKAIEEKHAENLPDDSEREFVWKQIWDSQTRSFVVNTAKQ